MKMIGTKEEWEANEDAIVEIAQKICDAIGPDYPNFVLAIRRGGLCLFLPADKGHYVFGLPLPRPDDEKLAQYFVKVIKRNSVRELA